MYNNIVYRDTSGRTADFQGDKTGITTDYNFWVGSSPILRNAEGPHDVTGDVKIEIANMYEPSSYRPQPDSPAIDTGLNVEIFDDYEGNSRPQGLGYDMGAYESSETSVEKCTESDWSYVDGDCQSNNQLMRAWTKTGDCSVGVIHLSTEYIDCSHNYGIKEDTNNDGIVDLQDVKEIIIDFGKIDNFVNVFNDVNEDGKVNLNDIIIVAKNIEIN